MSTERGLLDIADKSRAIPSFIMSHGHAMLPVFPKTTPRPRPWHSLRGNSCAQSPRSTKPVRVGRGDDIGQRPSLQAGIRDDEHDVDPLKSGDPLNAWLSCPIGIAMVVLAQPA
ncbi:hypothetical protein CCM_02826 [Cordyceps militaris CM01]|uniref:Uncharacterized protein n=1 Tax=Cordyceps militaris (strain CM01) TaxID=983644 RepID=G3JC40_CORMM|nr:uncharacterized protein CCM_02826 [Cordyceps militaris CM01]EGX94555.1 hypothetical protein CCM_02826 [Cordyceps militaris CM01]